MRVKCLAQEHKAVTPAWAKTQTAQSRNQRTIYYATAPLTVKGKLLLYLNREGFKQKTFNEDFLFQDESQAGLTYIHNS